MVVVTPITGQLIQLGHNASAIHAPGVPQAFPLRFRAFIPPAWINGPDPCVSPGPYFYTYTIYGGDHRNFSPTSNNFRLAADGIVTTNSYAVANPPGYDSAYRAGTTYRYADNALASDGYTLISDNVLHDCFLLDSVVQESWYDQAIKVTGLSPGSVTVNAYGSGTDEAAITGISAHLSTTTSLSR